MIQGYAEVELEALKQDATEQAHRDIAEAIDKDADDFAPKTLKLAGPSAALDRRFVRAVYGADVRGFRNV